TIGSGTSASAPFAAGAAALFLSEHPSATPLAVAAALRDSATADRISDPMGSPDLLLYTRWISPPRELPLASYGWICKEKRNERSKGQICRFNGTSASESIAVWQWSFGDGTSSD